MIIVRIKVALKTSDQNLANDFPWEGCCDPTTSQTNQSTIQLHWKTSIKMSIMDKAAYN